MNVIDNYLYNFALKIALESLLYFFLIRHQRGLQFEDAGIENAAPALGLKDRMLGIKYPALMRLP